MDTETNKPRRFSQRAVKLVLTWLLVSCWFLVGALLLPIAYYAAKGPKEFDTFLRGNASGDSLAVTRHAVRIGGWSYRSSRMGYSSNQFGWTPKTPATLERMHEVQSGKFTSTSEATYVVLFSGARWPTTIVVARNERPGAAPVWNIEGTGASALRGYVLEIILFAAVAVAFLEIVTALKARKRRPSPVSV